jgi:hypothetical protein
VQEEEKIKPLPLNVQNQLAEQYQPKPYEDNKNDNKKKKSGNAGNNNQKNKGKSGGSSDYLGKKK